MSDMNISSEDHSKRNIIEIYEKIRISQFKNMGTVRNFELQSESIFSGLDVGLKEQILSSARQEIKNGNMLLSRAVGCMVGMPIADSLGHNFEFEMVQDAVKPYSPHIDMPSDNYPEGLIHNKPYSQVGQFGLQVGQWTDDASMGLCIADSLLLCNGYNGSNVRIWFWNWLQNGINNAFRKDIQRQQHYASQGFEFSLSVGLGGNTAKSLSPSSIPIGSSNPPPRYEGTSDDAGNGSLMRLAAIPICFHRDINQAREMGYESSLTTHPGAVAAEACAFMSFVISKALVRPCNDTPLTAKEFLNVISQEYEQILLLEVQNASATTITSIFQFLKRSSRESRQNSIAAKQLMIRLLRSEEQDSSLERCWNWKSNSLNILQTLSNRGREYNGRMISPGYFGAYSMDGLAMALHALYHTSSFNEAIIKVINFCGDSDTTGSICAQMAGAFYGIGDINPPWIARLNEWDDCEFELRGILLYYMNDPIMTI